MKDNCDICNGVCKGHTIRDCPGMQKFVYTKALTKEEIASAVARAWDNSIEENGALDSDLANAIIEEIIAAQLMNIA